MACNCQKCPNLITVSSIAVSGGVTTLTVPSTFTPVDGKTYCFALFTTVPASANGNQISVTNGSSTWSIYNKLTNYWRPCCAIKERNIIKTKFYDDPVHFMKV